MSTKLIIKPRNELMRLPLSERMRHVKAALTAVGYSVVGYTPQASGNLIIRVRAHTIEGTKDFCQPPSIFAKRRAST